MIALVGLSTRPTTRYTMDVLIATGSYRLLCPCSLSSGRHTGMRFSGRKETSVKVGRSVPAVISLLSPAVTVSSIAPTAAGRSARQRTGKDSADFGRVRNRRNRNALELSKPFIHAGFRDRRSSRMNIRSSCLKKRLKSVFPIKHRIWRYPLKQKEPQITVITVFDGESKAKDMFADVIIQNFFMRPREKTSSKTGDNPV